MSHKQSYKAAGNQSSADVQYSMTAERDIVFIQQLGNVKHTL